MPKQPKDNGKINLKHPVKKREKLPPKGTAARVLLAAGLWSDLSREEINHIKCEIFGSRKSAKLS